MNYPLWNGTESIAQYANRAGVPLSVTLTIPAGETLEFMLVPSSKFIMGARPVYSPPIWFRVESCVGGGLVVILVASVLISAIRKRRRPAFSLAGLSCFTLSLGILLHGGVQLWEARRDQLEFDSLRAVYDKGSNLEKPTHSVVISRPYYISKYLITQSQYEAVMRVNPSNFKGKSNPVDTVSWKDAQDFCTQLTQYCHRDLRLPSECEWEFACRAGSSTAFYSGNLARDLQRVAWCSANSNNTTHPVGQKEPNSFGLYDMHGNVWQWCNDWYGVDYYRHSPEKDPRGPTTGTYAVTRGGCWSVNFELCRSGLRNYAIPSDRTKYVGFRVLLDLSP